MDSNLLLGVAAELLQNVLGDYAEAHRRPLQNCTPLEGTRQRWASAPTVATAAAAMAAVPAAAAAIAAAAAAAAPQAHSTGAAPAWRSWPACSRTFCAGRPPRHQTLPPPRHLCSPCAGGPPCQHRSRLQAAGQQAAGQQGSRQQGSRQQGWQCVKHTSAAAEVLACPASKDAAQFLPLQPGPVGTAQRGLTSDGEQLLVRAMLDHLATAHNCTRGWHTRRMAHQEDGTSGGWHTRAQKCTVLQEEL